MCWTPWIGFLAKDRLVLIKHHLCVQQKPNNNLLVCWCHWMSPVYCHTAEYNNFNKLSCTSWFCFPKFLPSIVNKTLLTLLVRLFFFCIGTLILQWLSWTMPSYRKLTIAEVCLSNVLQNVLQIEQRYIFTYRYLMMISFFTQLGLKETTIFKYLQLFF